MNNQNEINPEWVSVPFRMCGIADKRLLKTIREMHPTDKYEVTISSPDADGLCLYEVTEK